MTSVNVTLDSELAAQLAEEAEHTGLRRTAIVRLALRRWLTGRQEQPVGEERYQRVKHLIGSLDSGVPDLAERHSDEYLRRKLKREQEHSHVVRNH